MVLYYQCTDWVSLSLWLTVDVETYTHWPEACCRCDLRNMHVVVGASVVFVPSLSWHTITFHEKLAHKWRSSHRASRGGHGAPAAARRPGRHSALLMLPGAAGFAHRSRVQRVAPAEQRDQICMMPANQKLATHILVLVSTALASSRAVCMSDRTVTRLAPPSPPL
jgi:4-amino-4-deoxy-L-arabinose transferase-like glycosyltransferase